MHLLNDNIIFSLCPTFGVHFNWGGLYSLLKLNRGNSDDVLFLSLYTILAVPASLLILDILPILILFFSTFFTSFLEVTTTGLAGGLFWPYKGLLPTLKSKDSLNGSPAATSFTCQALKGLSYLLGFTGSPVNGSIYSLSVI